MKILHTRQWLFCQWGEGDGEREREDERGDDDGDDKCDDERGDDDDECDEAYGVTFLESTNGEDDNVNGDGGENPPEYEDVDNGDGGDGVGDGNGVLWDECVGEMRRGMRRMRRSVMERVW